MKLPEGSQVPRVTKTGNSGSLDVMASLVLSMIDGKSTILELGEMCGIDGELAQKIVADLMSRDLVEVPGFEQDHQETKQPDQISEIDDLLARIEGMTFYDILGVAPDADRKEMRSSYFSLSKKFHPDRAFGGNSDEKRKMEIVFGRITRAYDTLSNSDQRAEYDKYIADQIDLWKIEKQLKNAIGEDEAKENDLRESMPTPRSTSRSPTRPIQMNTIAPKRIPPRSRQSDAPGSKVSSNPPQRRPARSSNPPRNKEGSVSDSDLKARRDQLKRERMSRALDRSLSGVSKDQRVPAVDKKMVERKLDHARIALEQQEFASAASILKEVVTLDEKNVEAANLLEQAKAGARRTLAKGYLRQGRYERKHGDFRQAKSHFDKALQSDPGNLEARHLLSQTLLDLRSELPRALLLCKELTRMGGQKGRYFATLGELLLLAKENEQACDAFGKAISLEPDNKEYKKRYKACNG